MAGLKRLVIACGSAYLAVAGFQATRQIHEASPAEIADLMHGERAKALAHNAAIEAQIASGKGIDYNAYAANCREMLATALGQVTSARSLAKGEDPVHECTVNKLSEDLKPVPAVVHAETYRRNEIIITGAFTALFGTFGALAGLSGIRAALRRKDPEPAAKP